MQKAIYGHQSSKSIESLDSTRAEAARRGQARALGVANFDLLGPKVCAESFRRLLAAAEQPPALLALEVHPLNSNQEMCELCRSCGIQVSI